MPEVLSHTTPVLTADERLVVRKVMWRLLPFIILLYLMNYIDRVNVGLAKLQMTKDQNLDFSEGVFAFGTSIFFIAYFLFEIPSNLIQEKVGPRRWIARIMISWGLVSTAFMLVGQHIHFGPLNIHFDTKITFYSLRLLLGIAEAGFFPGMILYLSYWIPARQRARAGALFLTSTAFSGVIGNIAGSAIVYYFHNVPPFTAWQWLFLIEGIPTILLGVVVLFYLTDYPKDAHWLTPAERATLAARMASERHAHPTGHAAELKHAFLNPKVWLLGFLYGLIMFSFYVINYWTPTITKDALFASGAITESTPPFIQTVKAGLLSAIPFSAAAVGMVIIGLHSDRTNERRWHVAFSATLGALGLALAATAPLFCPKEFATSAIILGLSLAGVGIWGTLGPFWTLPPHLLTGTAAAAGIALVNSLGNLFGGFVGPNLIVALKKSTGSDLAGLLLATLTLLLAALVIVCTRVDTHRAAPAFPIDPNAPEQQPSES